MLLRRKGWEEMEETEVGMVATQDILIGQYLTPPIPPISYSNSPQSSLHCASRLLSSSNGSHCTLSPRLLGLLTNRPKLLSLQDDMSDWILEESASLASYGVENAERALCAVVTNGVEVIDSEGRSLGVGVYGPEFSWINHSCSPNSCYRFVFPGEDVPSSVLRITPSGGISFPMRSSASRSEARQDSLGNEPRVIVRSIHPICNGEEVTIAYTDLLQPKAARLSELWSKYRFTCRCKRCSDPMNYVDLTLQDLYGDSFSGHAGSNNNMHDITQRLSDFLDNAIQDYLLESDPRACCEKLEAVLVQGIQEMDSASVSAQQVPCGFPLHPMHFLSLRAFTTLASTYRAYSNQLIDLQTQSEALEALSLSKAASAYSVLLAGVVQHFSSFEPSLMVSLASFWTGAGESLLSVFKSPGWNMCLPKEQLLPAYSSPQKLECCRCSFVETSRAHCLPSHPACQDSEHISSDLLSCAADLASKIWGSLASGSGYLQTIKHPINFEWLQKERGLDRCDSSAVNGTVDEERLYIYHLGVHCLMIGGSLARVCFGKQEAAWPV